MKNENYCGTCYFSRFALNEKWCSHPEHHVKIKNWFGVCKEFEQWAAAAIPKTKKITIEETIRTINEKRNTKNETA